MLRAISFRHRDPFAPPPVGRALLAADERHLRRKTVTLADGGKVLVDLPNPIALGHGDLLVIEDGSTIEVIAAEEELYEVRAGDPVHLARLAWHLGNRHLPGQIDADRILVQRDHVIRTMLEGLGARVTEVVERFQPERGAYSGHDDHRHDASYGHPHPHDNGQ